MTEKMTMTHIEAHELLRTDAGVHIVLSTLSLTYIGWFQFAREISDGWVGVMLDDFQGLRITAQLPSRRHVHIEPFPPLAVGDLVVRRGFDDPDHRNYRRSALGRIAGTSFTNADRRRIYFVEWEGEPDARWHTRRTLEAASESIVDLIRTMTDAR
ncbi:hypothetical protein SEA_VALENTINIPUFF_19 [Microbacterium phage ValentiniPuff]|uniref:Uncharacterized protein n=1 Tax=Microbacterium phage ValentiniPuff TaxID=2315705 RepID=A0A386KPM9_9CAUD|nr:hypothetical protein SEA_VALENTINIPUFF_19 [Microbacterium phage ValentiniPuff]